METPEAVPYTPLPSERAQVLCQVLQSDLETQRTFDGVHPIAPLFGEERGHMFGVLLAKDGNQRKYEIKAYSGCIDGQWSMEGWAPPCFDAKRYADLLGKFDTLLKAAPEEERAGLSREAQEELNALYRFYGIDGKIHTMKEAFPEGNPPSGTGDCCAPRLLSECFRRGLRPVSMAEFFFGKENRAGTRRSGEFSHPCEERCHPLIRMMLGIDVVYADEDICVVDKPAGLLSVPGTTPEGQDCVVSRVKRLFPRSIAQPSVHRLDMDTSGLLVYGLTRHAQSDLSVQFAHGTVHKEYQAVLDGVLTEEKGTVDFPLGKDWEHRPYEIYDPLGKRAVTEWEKIAVFSLPDGRKVTRVRFLPHTGRTHQLRVHSASPRGLGHPIVGDRLYGTRKEGERLLLHASRLEILHPETRKKMVFVSRVPF